MVICGVCEGFVANIQHILVPFDVPNLSNRRFPATPLRSVAERERFQLAISPFHHNLIQTLYRFLVSTNGADLQDCW